MGEALEVVGLVAAIIAGFLVALPLGFVALSLACLWVSWRRTASRRTAAELNERARLERLAR